MTIEMKILDVVGDQPQTAAEIIAKIHPPVSADRFNKSMASLISDGKIQRIDGIPVAFIAAGIDLPVDVPVFAGVSSEGIQERLEAAFTAMTAPKYTPDQIELKTSVLDRLADIIDPSIAEVLMMIRADLVAVSDQA